MIDVLEKAVSESRADFTEIRAVEAWSTRIKTRNDEVEIADSGFLAQLGVRVLNDKSWGFASTNSVEQVDECVKQAFKLARVSSKKSIDASLADAPGLQEDFKFKCDQDPRQVDLEEKARRCVELAREGKKEDKVVAVDVYFTDASSDWYYINSEGASLHCNPVVTFFYFNAFVKEGGLFSASDEKAEHVGFELMDGLESLVSSTCEDARLLLKAKKPPKGRTAVVVDQEMAGTLAHEAIGHLLEADTIINGNSVVTKRNQLVGSPLINIVDDPREQRYFGSYPFDAEGVRGMKTQLVKRGRVKDFMNSRETAFKTGQALTGNARSAGPQSFPLVRMSNTFFEPGDSSLEELLGGIKEGVYVRGFKGGVSDTDTGFFQFAAPHGNAIKDDKLGEPLRDVTILGNILDALKKVDAVGKDLKLGFPGMCGKAAQSVPVSGGGPHLRLGEVLVG